MRRTVPPPDEYDRRPRVPAIEANNRPLDVASTVAKLFLMTRSFEDVAELAEFLDSGEPFDLNTMRAAIIALVHRAVATDGRLKALSAELASVRGQAATDVG